MVDAWVGKLRELAAAMPRPGCDWEDRPTFDPPASPEGVAALESAAAFRLPEELRAFLALTDRVVAMSVHNGYAIGGTDQLAAMVGSGWMPREVPDGLALPVATDGGGNGFLLSAAGQIWRWDHESSRVSLVARSFEAFLERIVLDWAAYIAGTPGWRFLV